MTDKPHSSASQLLMYAKCPEQYRRRYIEKEVIPPGMALLTGTGVHCGAEENFSQKIESHEDLPADDIVAAAVAGFESRAEGGGYSLTADEASRGAGVVVGAAKDMTATLAKLHAETQAPDYQPKAVEHTTRIVFPDSPRDMLAITDLRDDSGCVIDVKTAARKPSQSDVDKSTQLTIYAAAYHVDEGEPPANVCIDALTKTKTPARHRINSTRTVRDYHTMIARFTETHRAIDAGYFPPGTPDGWWCCGKWCGYARTCKYYNPEREDSR